MAHLTSRDFAQTAQRRGQAA